MSDRDDPLHGNPHVAAVRDTAREMEPDDDHDARMRLLCDAQVDATLAVAYELARLSARLPVSSRAGDATPGRCDRDRVRGGGTVSKRAVPVLYLDLDSTVRKGYDELGRFVNGPADVEVFPEAVTMMRRWKDDGGRVVGVTNQGGIALGHVREDQVKDALRETQEQTGWLFDWIAFCSHHPSVEPCWCRKPGVGMLVESALRLGDLSDGRERYPLHLARMVGDRDEDQKCAETAGLAFQWAHEWRAEAA